MGGLHVGLVGGAWPLVVVAVLMSLVAAFFYVRVIVLMFFSEPVGDGPTVAVPSVLTTVAITIGATMTLRAWASCPGPCSTWPARRGSHS